MRRIIATIVLTASTLTIAPATNADALTTRKCEQLRPYAWYVGWRGEALETILRVAWRETGGTCRTDLHNGRGADDSYGATQINTKGYLWHGHRGVLDVCGRFVKVKADLYNPLTNLWCARELWKVYGGRTLWRVRF